MRVYEVRSGDTPAKIAIEHAGCPKCAVDLVRCNPHKPHRRMPNGFLTFLELRVGERIWLPDKWFSDLFEQLPPAYFRALPSADGVTPSTLGDAAAGILSDYQALDAANARVSAMAGMADAQFSAAVGDAGTAINDAAREAYGSSDQAAAARAKEAQDGTQWAWQRNTELAAALASGDAAVATRARLDVQNALTTALGNARLALEALYAQQSAPRPHPGGGGHRGVRHAGAPAAPTPVPDAGAEPAPTGVSLGGILGVGLLAIGALVGAVYLARSRARSPAPYSLPPRYRR